MKKFATKTFLIISMLFVTVVGLPFTSSSDISADTGGVGYSFEETFTDSVLANLVAEHCGKGVTDLIEESDISSLTLLSCRSQGISDLTGVNHLTSLTILSLDDNQIIDLSPLANLTSLQYLYLDKNQISDISPLANLTNLIRLHISHNQISDISPLSNLNIRNLEIYWNQISDISPLANVTSLIDLRIAYNQISDISPVANLTDLYYLDFGYNHVSDLRQLANLINLDHLLLHAQTIISEEVPYNNPLVVDNPILDIEGLPVSMFSISNGGTQVDDKIIWSDLSEDITETNYSFRQAVSVGNATTSYYGAVEQPITKAPKELLTSIHLKGTVHLNNKQIENGMFTFVMEDMNGNNIATTTNDIDGNIDFGEISYTEVGEHVYTIKVVNDKQENITYDKTEHTVTVSITEENNSLVAHITFSGDSIVFNNTYNDPEKIISNEPISESSKTNTTSESKVQTGDYTNPIMFILSAGIVTCIFIMNKRKVYK